MNSLTILLYLLSVAVIALLAVFAAHNHRSGWKKTRTTLTEALDDFYDDLGLNVRDTPARTTSVSLDPGSFSLQLANLQSALGEANSVTAAAAGPAPVQAR
jgi:hypothetical protein